MSAKGKDVACIYRIKISLARCRPPIWRRVLVHGSISLGELHEVIQVAMGWFNSHLHQFIVDGVPYGDKAIEDWDGDDGNMEDERKVTLAKVAPQEKDGFYYEYDFGDSWQHVVKVEKISPKTEEYLHPVCLAGARACPMEDCGGVPGFERLLEVLQNPDAEDEDDLREWAEGYDPEHFDLDKVNRALKRIKLGR